MNTEKEVKDINGIDGGRLLSYIERIEHIEEQKKVLQYDIKYVFDEAKSANFDIKALKEILKIRKNDPEEQAQTDFIIEEYKRALGMA
ncbi:MAG: DUF2312 domain-containing protein [Alphaproteobacteria bacterium]|nr:DUF2312 domain-containing protein [Alphaproteobacteria bacterium]